MIGGATCERYWHEEEVRRILHDAGESLERDRFEQMGADSCDGTGLCRYTHMRVAVRDRHPLFLRHADEC